MDDKSKEFKEANDKATEVFALIERLKHAEDVIAAKKSFERANAITEHVIKYSDGFHKHLTTILVGFVGLLISLSPVENLDQKGRILFLCTVLLLSLCILFSVLTIFGNVILLKKWSRALRDYGEQKLNIFEKAEEISKIKENWIFVLCEILTLIMLFLGIVTLFLYTINMIKVS